MNKSQLIDALAARFDGNKKAAAHALESVLDTITREVARGEKVAITGFGSFEKRLRPARMVRNPQTGEQIKTKKTFVPKFSAGADLKNVVSGVKKLPKLTLPSLGKQAPATKAAPAKVAAGPATSTKEAAAASKTTTVKSAPAKKTTTKAAPAKAAATKKAAPAKAAATKKAAPAKAAATKKAAPAKTTTKRAAKKA
ncbi:hypothetical protein JCM18899A_19790 [Nocardioides sp. AN3]